MKIFIILTVAFMALLAPALGKTFTRCSLARAMYALGVPKSELPQWTCIADHESNYRTNVVGPPNSDGSNDYGIFQINGLYWCQPPDGRFSYNGCKISCNSFLTDDIGAAVKCARQVKNTSGFEAWSTWKYCSGNLPSINDCF